MKGRLFSKFFLLISLMALTVPYSSAAKLYLRDTAGLYTGEISYNEADAAAKIRLNAFCYYQLIFTNRTCVYQKPAVAIADGATDGLLQQIAKKLSGRGSGGDAVLQQQIQKKELTDQDEAAILDKLSKKIKDNQDNFLEDSKLNDLINTKVTQNVQPSTQIVYQVIERAVPGPKGDKGDRGETGGLNSPGVASYAGGAQFTGYSVQVNNNPINPSEVNTSNLNTNSIVATSSSLGNATTSTLFTQLLTVLSTIITSLSATNATISNATATQLVTNLFTATSSVVQNSTTTNLNASNVTISGGSIQNATITQNFYLTSTSTFDGNTYFSTTTAASSTVNNLNSTTIVNTNSSTTNLLSQNSTNTNATTTNQFTNNFNATNVNISNATTVNQYFSNTVGQAASITAATFTSATTTNLFASIFNSLSSIISNLTATNLTSTNGTFTNATSSNFFTSTASSTNLFSSLANFGSAVISNLFAPNIQVTNIYASTSNATTSSSINLFATNATLSSATATNLSVSNLIFGVKTGWLYGLNGAINASTSPTVDYITATTSTSSFKDISLSGNIIPETDAIYSLGSPSRRFKDLYVSSSTIYIDGNGLSNQNGQLVWNGTGIIATTTTGSSTLGITRITELTADNATATNFFATNFRAGLTQGYVWRGNSSNISEATSTLFISEQGLVGIGNTTPDANLKISQGTLTGSAQGALVINGTWNNGSTIFKGIELDITNTAAHTNSNLFNLLLGGSSVFKVTGAGNTILSGNLSVTGTTTINTGLDMSSTRIINVAYPTQNTDAANKAYVDSFAQGVFYQSPVITISTTTIVSSTTGDRYIVGAGSSGTGCTFNQVAQNTGIGAWSCQSPATGTSIYADQGLDQTYNFNGTSWVQLGSTISHQSLSNIQGGQAGEYYHLNAAQYSSLNSVNAQLDQLKTTGTATQFVNLTLTGGLNMNSVGSAATITNATTTNLHVSGSLTTAPGIGINTSSTTVSGTGTFGNLFVTGSSTLASTSASNLTVLGNLAASALKAVDAAFSTLFSPTIYVTTLYATTTNASTSNSATSNVSGTLTAGNIYATGSSTLASTTVGNATFTGTTNFASLPKMPLTNGYIWRGSTSNLAEQVNSLFISDSSNVGVGDSSPSSLFTVGNGDLFQVNTSGDLIKIDNVTYNWPGAQGGASTILLNDGAGNLSWGTRGVTTMAVIGASPNTSGASISGTTLTLQPADATNGGVVTTGTQTFAGAKTFSGSISTPNLITTGNVGIGDASPASLLTVGNGDLFQVNSSGNLVRVNNVAYSWPGAQGAASTVLTNDGAGNLTWAAGGGGGGGVTTMTAIGATPNANGASISGVNLTLQPADATNGGVLTNTTQTIAGNKTFTGSTTFSGGVDFVNGDVGSTLVISSSNVVLNNVNIGNASKILVTGFNVSFTGFAGGVNGRILYLVLPDSGITNLFNNDGRSSVGNRINNNFPSSLTLSSSVYILHYYNSKWHVAVTPDLGSTYSVFSDQNLKNNVTDLTSALEMNQKLKAVTFDWNPEHEDVTKKSGHSLGFVAQDVQTSFPEFDLVSTSSSGFLTLDYQKLTAILSSAINEISTVSGIFRLNLIAWLANTENSIGEIFAQTLRGKLVCWEDLCLNKSQVQNILNVTNTLNMPTTPSSNPTTTPTWTNTGTTTATPTSPIVTLNGEANLTLTVGDTFTDPLATITDDQDTGMTLVISGSANTAISGVYTIEYSSTPDTQGNTSNTVTRTITVVAPALPPEDPVSTSTASSTGV